MTAINAVTDYDLEGDVGVITLNSPPVNALSAACATAWPAAWPRRWPTPGPRRS